MSGVRCKRCGNAVAAGEVRYLSPTEFYCEECFLGLTGKARNTVRGDPKDYDISPSTKKRLECQGCGFINKVAPDAQGSRCSYCGSDELAEQRSQAAELLADSVDDTEE